MQELEKYIAPDLVQEISLLIEESKLQVVRTANSALTTLFWQVGKRVNDEILKNDRAQYGKQIIANVSAQLELKYGRNFAEKNLRRMMQFAVEFPEFQIVVTLSRQLSWSHFLVLLPIKNRQAKQYYVNLSTSELWSVRELRHQIERKAFERNEIANVQLSASQPALLNTFKDPYLLDFLNLKNTYSLSCYFIRSIFHHPCRSLILVRVVRR